KVLKGGGSNEVGGSAIRNSLVVFQFAISVLLIIGTIVVFQQLNFIQNKDLGFSKDQVLVINDVFTLDEQAETFKKEVERIPQVSSSTLSGYLPTPSSRSNTSFFQEGAEEQESAINMQQWFVDHDYMATLDLEILAGRDFSREFKTDSTAMILNETTVSVLGVSPEEVIGMRISGDLGEDNPQFYTVIGVVKNFHYASLRDRIGSLSMVLGNSTSRLSIKLNTSDLPGAIASIEQVWNKLAPGQPFDYYFLDESFNQTYEAEQRLGKIFIIFTLLSILIACLGLFGLAAFNAEKRTKEIGVRKVMGAKISQIAYRLTLDFLKLVGIAILIALPLGYFAMSKWLEDFTYRITIGIEVFVFAALIAVVIAIITVSYQSIKAAVVNPVKSLRTE
ncbi:ABC transporter permease, partial [Eudoraea sp.]|uniref:ABC transporter permease n=1 Tax=Eudoraea sp. TaxID=1979955 RepID=UPI003C75F525